MMKPLSASTAVALKDAFWAWSFDELEAQVGHACELFQGAGVKVLATLMDNGPAWVIADLAAARAGIVHVPLPAFFTPAQLAHATFSSGADALLTTPQLATRWPPLQSSACTLAAQALVLLRLAAPVVSLPSGTAKITFTSGTTGTPKGVCLDQASMQAVAQSLVDALAPLDIRRHLCALPFAVLLENIAGVMAPLMNGASCVTLPLAQVGLSGSSSFDVETFHRAVCTHEPHSVILLPQMLRAWVGYLAQTGQRAPASLRFAAVGGAAVGAALVESAHAHGIPAFEGYGLSEGASVQALNLPGAELRGSAGRALSHARIRTTTDGEIEITGSTFLGYLGEAPWLGKWWPTGDIGHIDADGFVHVDGRKKNLLITAFGRNVSPEWVETALRSGPAIAQAVVFGDAQAFLSAVLWPVQPDETDERLQACVDAANATLPDYARIRHWVLGRAPFTPESGFVTANGRPRRDAILHAHPDALFEPSSP